MASLREELTAQAGESNQQRNRNDVLAEERDGLKSEVAALREDLSNMQGNGRVQAQHIENLSDQVRDKQRQVDSLEEKHGHAREALEHYRVSVKEQREQDQRRHEQQVHQVHAEQRQLQQALAVKLEEQTQATRETTRLLTELTGTRKRSVRPTTA